MPFFAITWGQDRDPESSGSFRWARCRKHSIFLLISTPFPHQQWQADHHPCFPGHLSWGYQEEEEWDPVRCYDVVSLQSQACWDLEGRGVEGMRWSKGQEGSLSVKMTVHTSECK